MTLRSSIRQVALAALVSVGVLAFATTPAFAQAPWWGISSETVPTDLPPGGEGQLLVLVSNLGDAPIDGSKEPVVIANKLPPGLNVTEIRGQLWNHVQVECSLSTLKCSFKGLLYPYERVAVTMKVKAEEPPGTVISLPVEASVEGGGAPKVAKALQVPISPTPDGFGVADYELGPFNEDGTPATQAGSHPFQLTTTLVLNQNPEPRFPVELPKDLSFHLPPGLVGDPNAASKCTMANFFAFLEETNLCSPSSAVGVATVTADEPKVAKVISKTVPVFNLVPSQGEPARFGFEVLGKIPIVIDTSVRSGRDYGVDVNVEDATETAGLLSSQVTFWGVPGDPRHNNARGWECVAGGTFSNQTKKTCPATGGLSEEPFLTLPSSCAASPQVEPIVFALEADSWAHAGTFLGAEYAWISGDGQLLGFEGCDQLPFSPSIDVTPEQHSASTPTGLSVDVKVPQQTTLEAGKLAEADVRDTTVTLPQGVELSPSAANGLEACSEAQVGFTGFNPASQTNEFNTAAAGCPDGSKVGTVRIKTPLLSHELEGAVYLASPAPSGEAGENPFNSLVALYLVAEDPVSGVLVKLAGEGQLDEGTLRIATTFRNAPQVPFEDLKLDLFGGPRASVTTPRAVWLLCHRCRVHAVVWHGPAVSVLAPGEDFLVSSGVGGSACPGGVPFNPGFKASSQSTQAGAFSGFNLELARPDGDQALKALSMHLPSGIAAMLSSVTLCSDAQAAASACPPDSEVGHAIAVAGLGPEPYVQEGGRVFITGPYGDAPFGLEIVAPAKAGPFDLGTVTVLSKLYINPSDASVTIVSDPLPTQLRGIPLQLKRVLVSVDRPNFEFNPTNCSPMQITGTITGDQGASQNVASPFQVGGCENLPFHPSFSASTKGQNSKANGAGLTVKVGSTPGQANIGKAMVVLPPTLPSRLTTIQKACVDHVFEANPASCPEGSLVGSATVRTPVLRSALTGPAYLVSHGGAAFPDLEFVLQGEGITLILDGQTAIRKGITSSTFNSVPDAPVSSFETVLPQGPHSALTTNLPPKANYSLCTTKLTMPTTLTGQNGAVVTQQTKVAVEGCGGVKAITTKKLTRAQKLAKALKACRKKFKHSKARRQKCERTARKHYRPLKKKHAAKKAAHKNSTTRTRGR